MNGGPQSLQDWIKYLHAAAQVPRDHADYAEARTAMGQALRHINALQVGQNMIEATQAEQVGPVASVAGGLLHGASLGTGELARGTMAAFREGLRSSLGQPALPERQAFRQGAQEYRDALSQMEASNPALTATAELAGPLALPGAAIAQAGGRGIQAGVPLTMAQIAGRGGQGLLAGGTLGAVSGFAAGGEDPGDVGARLQAAQQGAQMGALLGLLGASEAGLRTRAHVERAAEIANKGTMRALQAQRLANAKAVGARIAGRIGPTGAEGLTTEEAAAAAQFGLPVEAVRGKVGTAALRQPVAPMPYSPVAARPEPMDVPTFMRRPQAPIENAGLLAPTPQSAPMVAGNAAIPGRPDLGLLAPAGPYQTAGSPLRTVTPSTPTVGPISTPAQIALQVRAARAFGMTDAVIARHLARLGITPQQVQAALR